VVENGGGRLGRGLSALLGSPGAGHGLVELDLEAIRPNPSQPRRGVDPAGIEALAESVRSTGVVQPVVVRPAPEAGQYELIAGERRWRAAKRAGLDRIAAVVRPADERERLEIALVENVVREDLDPIEVARACATLLEDFGQSQADLAARLGRSRPAIANTVRLLELPDEVQAMIVDGRLSEGHGRAVLMAEGARARRALAQRAVDEGLSVRALEALARRAAPRRRRAKPGKPAGTDEALDRFYAAFGAPVRVRPAGRGAIIVELRFADEAALREALGRLTPPEGGPGAATA
jgi:ParB family transcriptional regulator, chromosome partitioning protein